MTKKHILPKDARDICIIKTELCYLTEEQRQLPHPYLTGFWAPCISALCIIIVTIYGQNAYEVHEFDFECQGERTLACQCEQTKES